MPAAGSPQSRRASLANELASHFDLDPMTEWGAISEQDLSLLHWADTPQEAFEGLRHHLVTHHLEPSTAQESAAPGIAKTHG